MNRIIVITLSLLLSLGCSNYVTAPNKEGQTSTHPIDHTIFQHGVASGDPLSDRVIIWTRVSIDQKNAAVRWEVSDTKDFSHPLQSGSTNTNERLDYTVKVDVSTLKSGTHYYYRFIIGGKSSPIGRTKTLTEGVVDNVRLAAVSCSNYEFGYFNAYNGLAEEDLDAILHLGDYIYEYGPDKYGDKNFTRKHLPPKEITTLDDYRTRYAQYRTDKGLQRAHQSHPFIMIWDDHEIANNAYETGAQNHQPDEGDYMMRKKIAKQAYYEWQPIREQKNKELYRTFSFGDLADLIMLDERYTGRNPPPEEKEKAQDDRSMLGPEQLNWFKDQLRQSAATWKIIGNQVIFSPCDLSLVRPDSPVNLDAWDGYASERDEIRRFLSDNKILNTILVTGDTHSSWAFNVPALNYNKTGATCAVEIGTPSITSSNWNDSASVTDEQTIMGEEALKKSNTYLKYVNGRDHGYVILDISKDRTKASWHYTENIKVERSEIKMAKEITISVDSNKLSN